MTNTDSKEEPNCAQKNAKATEDKKSPSKANVIIPLAIIIICSVLVLPGNITTLDIPFLSPARGVTGEWTGSYFIEANMKHPDWNAEGSTVLDIKRDGNVITGSYTMENYRSRSITGTISSSQIYFTDGFVRFSGSFTSDTMQLNVESCSLDQYCKDPDKVSSSYAGEPGIKGNLVLYKGSNNLMANSKFWSDIPDSNKPIGNYPEGYIP